MLDRDGIRRRAREFSYEWSGASKEHADTQSFWNGFYAIFELKRHLVAAYEHAAVKVRTGSNGWIDLLHPGQMGVEQKSRGRNLDDAMEQLRNYVPTLPMGDIPWLLIACDFERFKWVDTTLGTEGEFTIDQLVDNLDLFWWLGEGPTPAQAGLPEVDVNLHATQLLADLHDRLVETGYPEHDMREWLTRILFCLFADDAEVWERKLFELYIDTRTADDGSDLGPQVHYLFQILNQAPADRPSSLNDLLGGLTYVNGDLFRDPLQIPACTPEVRDALRRACRYNWSAVSPAIFGSLFQNVMQPAARRHLGAHYTTEENIIRTIRPLFLDDLEMQLDRADSRPKLLALHDRLASMTLFDPACGCGNFLVISYRELRRLETEVLRRLQGAGRSSQRQVAGQRAASLDLLCRVKVDQFYGIELEEFPALIARTALYLADHLANRDVSAEFGEHFVRFPIPAAPHIAIDNALRLDWNLLLPADQADYVFGNPPFSGHSEVGKDRRMVEDRAIAFRGLNHADTRTGRLDYVAAWYAKAIPYMLAGDATTAFVSTNSLVQGEQARTMGPILQRNNITVTFAHSTFSWRSEAKGEAHVHVVIIGLAPTDRAQRRKELFDYPDVKSEPVVRTVSNINWYLTDAPAIYPSKHRRPLVDGVPATPSKGSQPTDGKQLLVSADDYASVAADPVAAKYLRPFRQTTELLYDQDRWCLWMVDATPADIRSSATLRRRLESVRDARLQSPTKSVRDAALTPALFTQRRQPTTRYLAIPEVSSENRRYIPMTYLGPEVIAGNKLLTLEDAPLWLFGILQSSMWMAWVRTIVGRMKSDHSIAPDLAYSAFPWPDLTPAKKAQLTERAQAVLDARPVDQTLAEMYDALAMPISLVKAHLQLDDTVDRSYNHTAKVRTDATRLRVLLRRYSALTGGDLTLFDDE
ncbi:MAG: DNA methyltransferase [Ilumatobacter sp.]|uniref:class I SAM-dependent DNA methyltransferase n=1 Tax=Ilumatobacter sp. TaxID=1967498 RepID=UPI003296E2B0